MLQTCVCVRLRCTDCGRLLREAAEGLLPTHYPTQTTALDALRSSGGRVGRGGCITCPDCGPTRLQTGLCVGVRCEGCTHTLTTPAGHPAHYPNQTTATAAITTAGWRTRQGDQAYCPLCTPMLTCHAHGHDFGPWRLLALTTEADPPDQLVVRRGTLAATPLLRAYRSCQRCSTHQSHHDWLANQPRISGRFSQGTTTPAGWAISTSAPERVA